MHTCTWVAGCDVLVQSGGGTGYNVIAKQLAALGVQAMYGVIGIPVTELASAAQVVCAVTSCCHAWSVCMNK